MYTCNSKELVMNSLPCGNYAMTSRRLIKLCSLNMEGGTISHVRTWYVIASMLYKWGVHRYNQEEQKLKPGAGAEAGVLT